MRREKKEYLFLCTHDITRVLNLNSLIKQQYKREKEKKNH